MIFSDESSVVLGQDIELCVFLGHGAEDFILFVEFPLEVRDPFDVIVHFDFVNVHPVRC